jgi:hypothetical protein
VTPDAALARILRGVGVLAEAIPSTVEERSAMLRSRLAGARMLMLLGNAHDADQVRPLLPGSGNLVVVTSRNQLWGLVAREGAKRLALRSFGKRATPPPCWPEASATTGFMPNPKPSKSSRSCAGGCRWH